MNRFFLNRRHFVQGTAAATLVLRIEEGVLDLTSLQVPGMGFAPLPKMEAMAAPKAWLQAHLSDADLDS